MHGSFKVNFVEILKITLGQATNGSKAWEIKSPTLKMVHESELKWES